MLGTALRDPMMDLVKMKFPALLVGGLEEVMI
jgi:hypothetical protein